MDGKSGNLQLCAHLLTRDYLQASTSARDHVDSRKPQRMSHLSQLVYAKIDYWLLIIAMTTSKRATRWAGQSVVNCGGMEWAKLGKPSKAFIDTHCIINTMTK
jgi:hypothetical protein